MEQEIKIRQKEREEKMKQQIDKKRKEKEQKKQNKENAIKIRNQLFDGGDKEKKQVFLMDQTKYFSKSVAFYMQMTYNKYPQLENQFKSQKKRNLIVQE